MTDQVTLDYFFIIKQFKLGDISFIVKGLNE